MKADLAAAMDIAMRMGISPKTGVTGVTDVAEASATCANTLNLQRLRPLRVENSELPNRMDEGVTDQVTGTLDQLSAEDWELSKAPSVSFVTPAVAPEAVQDAIEERAAHLEFDAGLPRNWAEPFARLLCSRPPRDFDPARWRRVVDAGRTFADQWGAKAYQLGWQAEDVFGLHPTAPAARNDCKGIAWLLDRGHVVAIDAAGADIVTEGGAKQRFYRKVNAPGIDEAKE